MIVTITPDMLYRFSQACARQGEWALEARLFDQLVACGFFWSDRI